MPQIQPNSPQRLNPLPNTSETQNGDDNAQKSESRQIRELAEKNHIPLGEYIGFKTLSGFKKYLREKKQKRMQDLIKSAKIPKIFTDTRANSFKITNRNETAAITAIKAITDNSGLFIYGECGTGKTMLASIIANERAERDKSSMFLRTVDILHELNPFFTSNKTDTSRKRNLILKIPCLIIDDLGAEKPSDFTRATLFDILDYRMNENLQTIITTNFNINELQNRLNSNEELNLSEKIIRRIKTTCKLIELNHF